MDPKRYKDIVYKIIGAAMKVHSILGWGLLESMYNEALHMELLDRGIDNEQEKMLPCYYKNHLMKKSYRMDIVIGDIVVELKSSRELISTLRAHMQKEKKIPYYNVNNSCSIHGNLCLKEKVILK